MIEGEDFGPFTPGVDKGLKKWLVMREMIRNVKQLGRNDILITSDNRYKYHQYWKELILCSRNQVDNSSSHEISQYTLAQFEALLETQSFVGLGVIARTAMEHRSLILLDFLLKSNRLESVNVAIDEHHNTLLHIACVRGDFLKVQAILAISDCKVNLVNNKGRTALHVAAAEESSVFHSPHILEMLLLRGADCRIQDNRGYSPLHCACITGCEKSVSILLSHHSGQRAIRLLDLNGRLAMDVCRKLFQPSFLDICAAKCTKRQNLVVWARVVARNFVSSVFQLVEPVCATCKRKVMVCMGLKQRDYRHWMHTHGRLARELTNKHQNKKR